MAVNPAGGNTPTPAHPDPVFAEGPKQAPTFQDPVDRVINRAERFIGKDVDGDYFIGGPSAKNDIDLLEHYSYRPPATPGDGVKLSAETGQFVGVTKKIAGVEYSLDIAHIPVRQPIVELNEQQGLTVGGARYAPSSEEPAAAFITLSPDFLAKKGELGFGTFSTTNEPVSIESLSPSDVGELAYMADGAFAMGKAKGISVMGFADSSLENITLTAGLHGLPKNYSDALKAYGVAQTPFVRNRLDISTAGTQHRIDPTPSDLDDLDLTSVKAVYDKHAANDPNQVMSALGIRSEIDLYNRVAHYASTGGRADPSVSLNKEQPAHRRALPADVVLDSLDHFLADSVRAVNNRNGRVDVEEAALAELGRVHAEMARLDDVIAGNPQELSFDNLETASAEQLFAVAHPEKTSASPFTIPTEQDIAAAKSQRAELQNQKSQLENILADLPNQFAFEPATLPREQVLDILEQRSQQDTRPATSSPAYADTQALRAVEREIAMLEKAIPDDTRFMAPGRIQVMRDRLEALQEDKRNLQAALLAATPIPVEKPPVPDALSMFAPIPTFKPELPVAIPALKPELPPAIPVPRPLEVLARQTLPANPEADGVSAPVIDAAEAAFSTELSNWIQGWKDLGASIGSHYREQMAQPDQHYSVLEERDFGMFGRRGESIEQYSERANQEGRGPADPGNLFDGENAPVNVEREGSGGISDRERDTHDPTTNNDYDSRQADRGA